jgi:integrase
LKHTKEFYSGENPFVFKDEVNKKRFSKPKDNARKRFLSEEETRFLLEHMRLNATHQNYTIVLTSLATGARPDTVLNIRIEDINFQKRELKLYDFKRKMYYTTRLTGELEKAFRRQMSGRSKKEFLFYSEESQGLKQLSEYPRSIKRILDKLFNQGLEKGEEKVTPYTFRHTFANLLLQVHKVPVFDVSKLLNHASVQTTIDNYIDFDHENVARELDRFENALTGTDALLEKKFEVEKLLKKIEGGVSSVEFESIKNRILSYIH